MSTMLKKPKKNSWGRVLKRKKQVDEGVKAPEEAKVLLGHSSLMSQTENY